VYYEEDGAQISAALSRPSLHQQKWIEQDKVPDAEAKLKQVYIERIKQGDVSGGMKALIMLTHGVIKVTESPGLLAHTPSSSDGDTYIEFGAEAVLTSSGAGIWGATVHEFRH